MKLKNRLKKQQWRRITQFFAAFFCVAIIGFACKKKLDAPVGEGLYPQEDIMGSFMVDTFSLTTYTVEEDSIASNNPEFNLIGAYHDDVFGKVEASFYTQLTLSGFSPDFGDLSQKKIDSAFISFEYGGYYGRLNEQLFEVYELDEPLSRDSTYYGSDEMLVKPQNLVPTSNNQGWIKPEPLKEIVIGGDTVTPQLRIPLDTNFARSLLEIAQTSVDDEAFLEDFQGLYLKVDPQATVGNTAILYLASTNSASKLTVYYSDTVNGPNHFDFIMTNRAADFNHVEVDNSGTVVGQIMADSTLGQQAFYAQAFISRGKIEFPFIDSLPKDIFIHSATLELPVSYYPAGDLYPSEAINVVANLYEDDDIKYKVSEVSFDPTTSSYLIDLRTYIQNVLAGEIENYGIFVSPKRYNATLERIIFNGVNTSFKKQPKLKVLYTKL